MWSSGAWIKWFLSVSFLGLLYVLETSSGTVSKYAAALNDWAKTETNDLRVYRRHEYTYRTQITFNPSKFIKPAWLFCFVIFWGGQSCQNREKTVHK